MKYFKNLTETIVYGYNESDKLQINHLNQKKDVENLIEIDEQQAINLSKKINDDYINANKPAQPTISELQAQLALISAQINALANKK